MAKGKNSGRRKIAVALAGGGAHSAFTWGVLQYLLDDLKDNVHIVAVSGTSGGAMNATMLAYGLGTHPSNAEAGARRLLEDFWRQTSLTGDVWANPYRHVRNPFWDSWNIDATPVPTLLNIGTSLLAPAQWTPPHFNPLRGVLLNLIDFKRLREDEALPDLYIAATNVRTSQLKVFRRQQVTPEVLCASACLPSADWAVVIDNQPYWDGGYRADPAISPLLQAPQLTHPQRESNKPGPSAHDDPVDVMLVGINPLIRDEVPTTAWQIIDRMNEISLNSSVIDEVKRIMMMNDLLDDIEGIDGLGADARRKIGATRSLRGKRQVRLHFVEDEKGMGPLGVASKNNTSWPFLEMLRDMGYEAAKAWWNDQGGRQDIENIESDRWRKKIDERFINRHHWTSDAAPAHDRDEASKDTAKLAAVTGGASVS